MAWTFGITLLVVLIVFGALMIDWIRSAARTERDVLIEKKVSSDGKIISEVHKFTSAMHGGPDLLYVIIKLAPQQVNDHTLSEGLPSQDEQKIYSRTYECSDYSAFHIEWTGSEKLTVYYGECNTGSNYSKEEDTVWEKRHEWHDVKIEFQDTKYVATH